MTPEATLRTRHDRPSAVAAAVRPDNTDEMTTRVAVDDGGDRVVETTISRDSTGGLRTTVDDYVTNLAVADRLTDHDTQP
jgi:hypothetical protein